MVKLLIEKYGANVNQPGLGPFAETPFLAACRSGKWDVVKLRMQDFLIYLHKQISTRPWS